MPAAAYTYDTTFAPGAPYAVGAKIDVVVKDVKVHWAPKDLLQKRSEILMTATLTSGATTKCWTALAKDFRGGQEAFNAQKMPYFIAHDFPLDTQGAQLTLEIREVDDLTLLKKILEKANIASPVLGIIPVAGAVAASAANMAVDVAKLLPDQIGRVFFAVSQNFAVQGGLNPHGLPLLTEGVYEVRSKPKTEHKNRGGASFTVGFL